MKTLKPQTDYTAMTNGFQLVIPLDCEVNIAKNSPVRLLNAVMERMDYSKLYAAYSRLGRIEYSPKILLKIMVYGYMRKQISSRALEACCRENIHFMYLLEGQPAPDHNTINRFRKNILTQEAGQDILRQLVLLLHESSLLSFEAAFIDGTKIEANANQYSFVWKKATVKKEEKLLKKIYEELPQRLKEVGIRFHVPEKIAARQLKKLRKRIYERINTSGIEFVSGKGKRKTPLQRLSEQVDQWLAKIKQYTNDIHICGNRNSYSKTDHDATFMHMKEDHMKNGQLKPGYNVNVATCSEFIIGSYISSDRNDVHTLIPFMNQLRRTYEGKPIGNIVVDSGYESEENYCWFEDHPETALYVKPSNHEARKHKKYRTDISRRENMIYDPEANTYTCAAGKLLRETREKKTHTASGLETTISIYECSACSGCPLKEKCIRACGSKKPLEERHKVLHLSKRFIEQREAMEAKISSPKGCLLRVNRSIQAEGNFAYIKHDLDFRRFLLRGNVKVAAEWLLFSLALNILKMHHKIQNKRLGSGLVVPKQFPAGL